MLYGAFVVDDTSRTRKGKLPKLYYRDYDHKTVATHNIADMGCIAHRSGLPEAISTTPCGKWAIGICFCGSPTTHHRSPSRDRLLLHDGRAQSIELRHHPRSRQGLCAGEEQAITGMVPEAASSVRPRDSILGMSAMGH